VVFMWESVGRIGELEVRAASDGILNVKARLSRNFEPYWTEIFKRLAPSYPLTAKAHAVGMLAAIEMACLDDELEDAVDQLDHRIAATNEAYRREVLPLLKADQEARERKKLETERRQQDAEERARRLAAPGGPTPSRDW
jgi:hypothetical protein